MIWGGRRARSISLYRGSLAPPGPTRQAGQVAVLFALTAVLLIAVVGLAVDTGQAYSDQSSLQSGADAASEAATQLLYSNAKSNTTYTGSDVYQVVQSTFFGSTVAGLRSTSATMQYVGLSSTGTPTPLGLPVTVSPPPNPPSDPPTDLSIPAGATGVQVSASYVQATFLLGVVGIGSSHPAATSTSLFGAIACVLGANCAPFAVWGYNCQTGSPLPWAVTTSTGAPEIVTYFGTGSVWKATASCGGTIPQSAAFTGYLPSPSPPVFLYQTDSVVKGTGVRAGKADTPLSTAYSGNQLLIIPEVVYDSSSGNGANAQFTVTGFMEIKMDGPCVPSTQSSGCQGTVVAVGSSIQGLSVGPVSSPTQTLSEELLYQ